MSYTIGGGAGGGADVTGSGGAGGLAVAEDLVQADAAFPFVPGPSGGNGGFGAGGGALGAAIFNHGGGIRILNSTFKAIPFIAAIPVAEERITVPTRAARSFP
jgi:hypothetical protein